MSILELLVLELIYEAAVACFFVAAIAGGVAAIAAIVLAVVPIIHAVSQSRKSRRRDDSP